MPSGWDSLAEPPAATAPAPPVEGDWDQFSEPGATSAAAPASPPVPQSTGWDRVGKLVVGALTSGALNTLEIPGELAQLGLKYLPNTPTRGDMGLPTPQSMLQNLAGSVPAVEALKGKAIAAGLMNRPDTKPSGTLEDLGVAAGEGAGSVVPPALALALPTGGASLLAIPADAGLSALSGLAAEGAHKLWPDSTIAPIVAGAVGGYGAGTLANKIANAGSVANLSREVAYSKMQQAAAKGDSSAWNAAKAASDKALEAEHSNAARSIVNMAQDFKPADADISTKQTTGQFLQSKAQDWEKALGPKLDAQKSAIAQAVPDSTPAPVTNFAQTLRRLAGSQGQLDELASLISPHLTNNMKRVYDEVMSSPGAVNTPSGIPSTVNFGDVQALKSALGTKLNSNVTSETRKSATALYAAADADAKAAAASISPEALQTYTNANGEMTRLFNVRNNFIEPIASAKYPENLPGSILRQAKNGGTQLGVLRNELPEATQALGSHALLQGKEPGQVWSGLSPEAKAALAPTPSIADHIDQTLAGKAQATAEHAAELERSKSVLDSNREDKTTNLVKTAGRLLGAGALSDAVVNSLVPGLESLGPATHVLTGLAGAAAARHLGGMAKDFKNNPLEAIGKLPGKAKLTAQGAVAGRVVGKDNQLVPAGSE